MAKVRTDRAPGSPSCKGRKQGLEATGGQCRSPAGCLDPSPVCLGCRPQRGPSLRSPPPRVNVKCGADTGQGRCDLTGSLRPGRRSCRYPVIMTPRGACGHSGSRRGRSWRAGSLKCGVSGSPWFHRLSPFGHGFLLSSEALTTIFVTELLGLSENSKKKPPRAADTTVQVACSLLCPFSSPGGLVPLPRAPASVATRCVWLLAKSRRAALGAAAPAAPTPPKDVLARPEASPPPAASSLVSVERVRPRVPEPARAIVGLASPGTVGLAGGNQGGSSASVLRVPSPPGASAFALRTSHRADKARHVQSLLVMTSQGCSQEVHPTFTKRAQLTPRLN